MRFARAVNPAVAFPVHDWLLNEDGCALSYELASTILSNTGISFMAVRNGESIDV
jgi:hypothetical protein